MYIYIYISFILHPPLTVAFSSTRPVFYSWIFQDIRSPPGPFTTFVPRLICDPRDAFPPGKAMRGPFCASREGAWWAQKPDLWGP